MNVAPPSYTDATVGQLPPPPAYTAPAVGDGTAVTVTINNKVHVIDPSKDSTVTPSTTLAQYIRANTRFTGLKTFCREGGCGACTVALSYVDSVTNKTVTRAAHSCLRPILSCNNMTVTTNDGLGNARAGYNPIQTALAQHNGSQCGFCSNGFVMSMYAMQEQAAADGVQLTELDIEKQFDGNLCRCTGYRPILDAMKTFATAPTSDGHHGHADGECGEDDCRKTGCKRKGVFKDVEDMADHIPLERREYKSQPPAAPPRTNKKKLTLSANGSVWQDCPTVQDLNFWLPWYKSQGLDVMLTVSATSLGVYPSNPTVRLNIAEIASFKTIVSNASGILVGPSVPITDLINFADAYYKANSTDPKAAHLPQLVKHLHRVASVMIRNVGSVMGNISISLQHQSETDFFCSDIATLFAGLGARFTVFDPSANAVAGTFSLPQLYTMDLSYKYVSSIFLPWAAANETFQSYKIAIRQVNSHALVNAAMRATVVGGAITAATIVYGGIWPRATHVASVETALVGLQLTDVDGFRTVASTLTAALTPAAFTGRIDFRRNTAVNYFYKFFLSLQKASLPASLQSATDCWLTRSVSSGTQAWQPDPNEYPVSIGMPKIEAIQQTSGHAVYTDDLASTPDTLYGYLVVARQSNCTLQSIDVSAAQAMPGFVAFYSAKDIPAGLNGWENGEIFSSGQINFYGQAVGVVLATTSQFAKEAADAVVVTYSNVQPSVVTVKDALAAKALYPAAPPPVTRGDVTTALAAAPKKVTDTVEIGYQYHFHLENHITYVIPREDVLEVHCATQMPVGVQMQVAAVTGLPASKVIVSVKRCGGGYGGKITNSLLGAAIAGFCSYQLQVPVKVMIDLQQTTSMLGCRGGKYMEYTVGFDNNGVISAMQATVTAAAGQNFQDEMGATFCTIASLDNAYMIPNVNFAGQMVKMNIPATGPVRGPGWVPAVQLMESVISRIASELNMAPEAVREANFFKKGDTTAAGMVLRFWNMPEIWADLKQSANYTQRQADVAAFNAANRWRKRGLAMTPVRFGVGQAGANFGSLVTIYPDGTVGITHGGTEIGQGINTKVIQVAAYKLGLTKDQLGLITVNETCTRTIGGASNVTGGSVTSELCALSVMHACEELNRRLNPFRGPNVTWQTLIGNASAAGVDLAVQGWTNAPPAGSGPFNYNSTSAALSEVELDVLTGQYEIRRVDIVFDCGISLNAMIDIGQVEGGFMFGVGYFLLEEVSWDPSSGQTQNGSTWEYKVPSAYDVPETFNVTLLKNAPNPLGVLGSKASGEPPVALASSVVQALESAITAAQSANSGTTAQRWVCKKTPLTVDAIQQAVATTPAQFTLS